MCSICSKKISLSEQPFGLVFEDEHFICEDCCNQHSEEEMMNWSKSIMKSPTKEGMPIALWLIHEQNKDKTMMSARR